MKKIDELFQKGMEYLQAGDYRMAEIHFKEAKEKHLKLVKKGIKGIENGHFLKTVLSRSEIFCSGISRSS